jgi:DNA-binding GntR family transcriptional regulator
MTDNTLGSAHLPLRDVVAAELRRLILAGEFAPGERLVEDRLAERLGVSRNPVADLNTAFHAAVAETAGNAYLSLVVGPMLRRAQWVFQQTAKHRAPHSWTEHLSLYEAIAEGDEYEAEARAVAHVEAARRSYLKALAEG